MRTDTRTHSTDDGPATAAVRRAFDRRCRDALPIVRSIVRGQSLPEEDAIVNTVFIRAWREFPRMHAKEQACLALGLPAPHQWRNFFAEVTRNEVIDVRRRLGLSPRPEAAGGPRRAASVGAETTGEVDRPPSPAGRHAEVSFAARGRTEEDADPVARAERSELRAVLREAFAALTEREQLALQTSLDDLSDGEASRLLETTRFSVYRLRQRAIVKLRRAFAARGYAVPNTTPPTHP